MTWKQHCDSCDGIIPEEDEAVFLVPKSRQNRDWRFENKERVACMDCIQALLPGPELIPAK